MAALPPASPPAEPAAVTLQALSADAALLRRLRGSRQRAVVHSVFERVINVEPERGPLFTLASRHVDDAPETIVLAMDGWTALGVAAGDPVRTGGGAVVVGGRIAIATANAVPWQATLPAWPADGERLRANLAAMRGHLARPRQARDGNAPCRRAEAALAAALRRLRTSCAAGDLAAAAASARSMIGLGQGLTPAGDDVLLGLFAVWHLSGSPCAPLAACGASILADLERRTNGISAAALRAAADGRVRESIVRLLRELVHGTPATLRAPLARVLAIGSSSGSDIARGIASGASMAWRAAA